MNIAVKILLGETDLPIFFFILRSLRYILETLEKQNKIHLAGLIETFDKKQLQLTYLCKSKSTVNRDSFSIQKYVTNVN